MTDEERAERCRDDLDYFAKQEGGSAATYLFQAKLELMRIVYQKEFRVVTGESRRRK